MKVFLLFLEPYNYRIWILILLVALHGVAISVFLFEYFQKRFTSHPVDKDVCKKNSFFN